MKHSTALLALATVFFASTTPAAIEYSDASSARIVHEVELDADAASAWALLIQPGAWWNDDHTWSGKAANMQVDARAGGCWCEVWEGNSVEHGRIIRAEPGKHLRLQGGFGPLQGMPVFAVMDFALVEAEGKTTLKFSYQFSGPATAQLDKIAPAVDAVMAVQLKSLQGKLAKAE